MTQQELLALEFRKNKQMGKIASDHYVGTELTRASKKMICGTYDFSVLGGAIGSVVLLDPNGIPAVLPKGAIVMKVIIDTITAPTSGGSATIALQLQSAGDLKAALAIASYTGLLDGIPVNTAASSIKMTADQKLTAVIATAALTAGKINVLVEYDMSL